MKIIATGVRPENWERKRAKLRAVISCCVFNIYARSSVIIRPGYYSLPAIRKIELTIVRAHFSIERSVKVENTVDANSEEISDHSVCLGAIPSQWVVVHFKSAQWFFRIKISRICANL